MFTEGAVHLCQRCFLAGARAQAVVWSFNAWLSSHSFALPSAKREYAASLPAGRSRPQTAAEAEQPRQRFSGLDDPLAGLLTRRSSPASGSRCQDREDSDVLVVAGIGGGYLGARAVVEAVKGMYHNELEDGLKSASAATSAPPT